MFFPIADCHDDHADPLGRRGQRRTRMHPLLLWLAGPRLGARSLCVEACVMLFDVCVLLLIVLAIDRPLRRVVEKHYRLRELRQRQQHTLDGIARFK